MSTIEFLDIDLDIELTEDVSLIATEFGDRASVMRNDFYDGLYRVTFDTGYTEENEIIEEYASLIGDLSTEAMRLRAIA